MLGVCLKYTQHNYGSKLQALATVKMFEKLGLDYEIIRYNKKTVSFYLKSLLRIFNIVFLNDRYDEIQKKIAFKRHPEIKRQVEKRDEAFESFDYHFANHLSEVYKSYHDLKINCGFRYSQFITCSDQLWSPSALGSGFYNLMFVPEEMNKVSWASSFGVSNIPKYQISRTKRYLRRIQHISMRENRGAEIVKELIGRDVPVLMDPVFVFSNEEWDDMVPRQNAEWDDYIFCYFLGDNKEHRLAAKKLADETGMKIVMMRHLDRYVEDDERFGDIVPYDVDPKRFLNILRNATYICTDSFHGTAFSIIFEKKFLVFDRYNNQSTNSKNSRIDSVCTNLELTDRRFTSIEQVTSSMSEDIDYTIVKEKLKNYQARTLDFLRRAFNEKRT